MNMSSLPSFVKAAAISIQAQSEIIKLPDAERNVLDRVLNIDKQKAQDEEQFGK